MSVLVPLSRLDITGPLYDYTPLCVLIEIAEAHGIFYESDDLDKVGFAKQLIQSINQTPVPKIEETRVTDRKYIARYVNKHTQWPPTKLLSAYHFLMQFSHTEDPLSLIPNPFISGAQTPTLIDSINACVLYKICIQHQLHITYHTSINQMANAVQMLRMSSDSIFRRAKSFLERDAKRADLINILLLSPYEIKDPEPTLTPSIINFNDYHKVVCSYEFLQRLHNSLYNIKVLQERMDPSTDSGAIALSAVNYLIDISRAREPLIEYKLLKISGRTYYTPADPWMAYWYERNPILFDLSVTYNPIFPIEYYPNLDTLVRNQGFTDPDLTRSTHSELLQMAYVTETFYLGLMPNMKSKETAIELDPVDDVPYGELLCYGAMEGPFQPVTMNELIHLFSANQNFTNPFSDDSVFSATALNKLKLITKSSNGPYHKSLSLSSLEVRNRLYEIIVEVEILLRNNDEPTRTFIFAYRSSSPDTKQVIIKTFTELLHLGMYMRGWLGPGHEFPVLKAPVPPDKEAEIALQITKSISEYERLCRSLGKIGFQLNNLPLVKYRDSHYQVSTNSLDGFTIQDRIEIVKQGDRSNNIASCIRLSSNWICTTAHKYLIALGQPAPFDIFNLRHIS
jgi:hypothetical protein